MTGIQTQRPAVAPRGRAVAIALLVTQIVVGVFFVAASAAPKLFGQEYAVDMFDDIGAGQWLRYFVGVVELAGGIGLLIPRLSGLAAIGLVGLMIAAGYTQVVVLDNPVMVVAPIILGVVLGLIAWGRWPETKALVTRSDRS